MSNIDSLLGMLSEVNNERTSKLYQLADEATAEALKIERKLKELSIDKIIHHHLFFDGGAEEYSDDVSGFYKALTWKNYNNKGFRLVYSEYDFDVCYDGVDNCTTKYYIQKPFCECSSIIRAQVGIKGLEDFMAKMIDLVKEDSL